MKMAPAALLTLLTGFLLVAQPGHGSVIQANQLPESVAVRSARQAGYLAESLDLSRRQRKAVARSAQRYFGQLEQLGETAERPGLVAATTPERLLPSPAALQAAADYEQELARIFTPGQYNGYSWLTRQSGTGR